MANNIAITLLLILSIWANHVQSIPQNKRRCFFTPKFDVDIANKLPSNSAPLKLHCASKNNDLGYHILPINDQFNINFCRNVGMSTLFFCHLWWGSKDLGFRAFDRKTMGFCDEDKGICYWEVRDDGLYYIKFTPPASGKTNYFVKYRDWNIKK
ncbi:hypothetical protein CASFOL_006186 [Castilleja foliolosa]|uniref:S-protein homolog n=1 Tax=Castilleja foliolosa TaxID=1961234 RepID=A0ABD3E5N6_9LAMI